MTSESQHVAAIEPHPRRPHWYRVAIAGRVPMQLHEDALVATGLHVGMAVTPQLLERLALEQQRAEAKHAALKYLSVRPRSRQELASALRRRGFADSVVVHVLAQLENLNLVNDGLYARELTRSLLRRRTLGRQGLRYRLEQRGLSTEEAETAVAEAVAGCDEAERALEALHRKLPRWVALDDRGRRQRAARYLAQLGFDEEAIADALARALPTD